MRKRFPKCDLVIFQFKEELKFMLRNKVIFNWKNGNEVANLQTGETIATDYFFQFSNGHLQKKSRKIS